MTRIDADELATLVRVFGERVRIGADGSVTIERESQRPASAVWEGRADPECSGSVSAESGLPGRTTSRQACGQFIGGPANLLAAPSQGAGVK